ncbi:MAG: TRAP transporter substrate-binding protein [Paracoccus sp. (in: a-proteobacteria)]|uniref:TRAP transporter substrate-binding protein n=1 Tax=Paracoccus sp. TaxID=267 RepID=UPI0026DEBA95|nr:TRAP transporter substrate-binding protein [Paracoccus sp. (in: a-proteobacteria)]MDO5631603.1 TRAP transporter substrate-binding protein [Paracoccus sp. (in: a-proteobacteria)]
MKLARISGVILLAIAAGTAPALAKTVLQLASVETPQTVWGQAAQRFADGVAEASGGEIEVRLSLAGSTGTPRETLEALTIGTNDIVMTVIASLNTYDQIAAIESYPYLFRDPAHFDAVFGGPVGEELFAEITERTGFRLVGAGMRGPRAMASIRAVNTVDDLAGLKIRVPNIDIYAATWAALGASPTPMSTNDVYSGLQSGIIDAVENPLSAHLRSKYYEAANFIIMTDHVYGAYTLIFDETRFARLSEGEQKIVLDEGRKAMTWAAAQEHVQDQADRARLEALGVTVIAPDLAPFREKSAAVAERFPGLQPWVERIQAVE